jgi:TonB family protein
LATSAIASQPFDQHVRAGSITLAAWSARVSAALDRQLPNPEVLPGESRYSGIVVVKFGCSDSGAPSEVAIAKSSGSRSLDRAALQGIRHVATLHPLPDGMLHSQRYQAAILFAETPTEARRLIANLQKDAETRNSWFQPKPQQTAAIAIMPVTENP